MVQFDCNLDEARLNFLRKSVRNPVSGKVGVVTDVYRDRGWCTDVKGVYFEITYGNENRRGSRRTVTFPEFQNYQLVDEPALSSRQ